MPNKIERSLRSQTRQVSMTDFQVRDNGDGTLTFNGYATTFNQPYSLGWCMESVLPGAFTKTLAEAPDVRLLINHAGLPLARTKSGTLSLSQDNTGLKVQAQLDANDPDVQSLVPKMARGDIDQMSFAFRIVKEQWTPDSSQVDLVELALDGGDVSIVTYPANPNTSASLRTMRSHMQTFTPEEIRSFHTELRELQSRDAVLSPANMNILQALLSDLTDIGGAINEIADDVVDAGDQLDAVVEDASTPEAEPADEAPVQTDSITPDVQMNSADDTDDEHRAGTSLALARAQAEALRLRGNV